MSEAEQSRDTTREPLRDADREDGRSAATHPDQDAAGAKGASAGVAAAGDVGRRTVGDEAEGATSTAGQADAKKDAAVATEDASERDARDGQSAAQDRRPVDGRAGTEGAGPDASGEAVAASTEAASAGADSAGEDARTSDDGSVAADVESNGANGAEDAGPDDVKGVKAAGARDAKDEVVTPGDASAVKSAGGKGAEDAGPDDVKGVKVAGARDAKGGKAAGSDGVEGEVVTSRGASAVKSAGVSVVKDAGPSDVQGVKAAGSGDAKGEVVTPGGASAVKSAGVSVVKDAGPSDVQGGKAAGSDDAKGEVVTSRGASAVKSTGGNGAKDVKPGASKDVKNGSGTGAVKTDAARGHGPTSEGRLLARRYRLGPVLGRGGMGTVWRAVDETLGRTVAVKELRFPNSIDEDEKRRLITRTLREAKAIAKIRNNGAVTVYDVVDEDNRPWIVMELIEGKSLAEAIREDGLLTPRRAAEVGLAVLDVLRSAHREGILHRDVKPSNVLIAAEDGRVVLTDFGIAQVEGDPSITSTGMLVGAPSYIAPERARGQKPGPAADLWSLGGLLYASVEGCPPYDKGSAIATLTAVMTEPLDPPKNAGPLEEVIYGLLIKDPAQRLDDAGARALLVDVVNAPERPAEPEPSPEATRVVALPPVPPPPPAPVEPKPKDPSAGRLRAALRSVQNAAAESERPRQEPEGVPARPAPARAPITDVVSVRTLVIILAVALLALVGVIVAVVLHGGSGKGSTTGSREVAATGGKTAGSGKGDGQSAGNPKTPGSGDKAQTTQGQGGGSGAGGQTSGGASGSGTGQKPGGQQPQNVGYRHDQGFSIGLPDGWKFTKTDSAGARFSGPNGQRLLVGWTSEPKASPVADWFSQEAFMGLNGYHRVGIGAVTYRGWLGADWEFTFTEKGRKQHSLDRGFVVNKGLGYGIMFTAADADWGKAETKATLQSFFDTFQPRSGS